jgi:alkylhydroperoxidase/carboxymuconolactone decarboxylase family protein YurZ
MEPNYPQYHAHLQQLIADLAKAAPGPMAGFTKMHQTSVADGVLAAKTKEMMALAISIAVHCDGCIAYTMH